MISDEQGAEIIQYITNNKPYPISTRNLRSRFRYKRSAINGFLFNHPEIQHFSNGDSFGCGKNNLCLWRLKGSDGKPHMKIQLINTSNL